MKKILKAFLLGMALSAMSLLAGCSDVAYEEEQVSEKTAEENNLDSARCGFGGNGGCSGVSGDGH